MMDILKLMHSAPGLLDAIKDIGVSEQQLPQLGSALGKQLGGDDSFDLTDILARLDLEQFLALIDLYQVAEQTGISPHIAQQAIDLIGPHVGAFEAGRGGGLLSALIGRFIQ